MRKILVSILLMTGLLSACSNQKNDLVVGMECNYAPFNWTQVEKTDGALLINNEAGSGYCDGYDIQIAQAIADDLGSNLIVRKISWDGLIPALQAGEIDMIVAGMTDTAERRASVSFSSPYYTSDLVLLVKSNSSYATATNLSDFTGANVIAQLSTFHDGLIDQIPSVNHMQPLTSAAALVNELLNGTADAMVTELPVGLSVTKSNANITIIQFAKGSGFTTAFEDTTVSVAVSLTSTKLLADINTALAAITTETRAQWMADAIARQPLSN